ncbi:MAG: penicillin-binding protein activator, partial [Thermodesulfobacteriota bacterium]
IQSRGIPAIMLSQKEGITQSGDYAFRNFLTPKAQAERLAEYAAKTLGLKTAAVLAPDNAYGKELTSWFAKAFTERGRLVSGEMSYEPGKKDFAKELVSLFGIKSEEKKEGRRRIVTYTPSITPEALFIPDYYGTISQIAPYLAFYGIKDIQLLGASGWNSPKLVELGNEYVEGAVFVDGFFAGSKRKGASAFVKLFKNAFGYEPGIIEAYAYDSTIALITATEKSGSDRKAVRDALSALPGFEGATGKVFFDANREAGQEIFVLKVEKGLIVEAENKDAATPKETSD